MNILFLSHTYIGSPFVVGSHQLAKEYSKQGHNVIHVAHPLSVLHLLLNRNRKGAVQGRVADGLWQVIPLIPLPIKLLLRFSKFNIFAKLIASQIKRQMITANVDVIDLCLIDDPSFHGVNHYLNVKTYIYRPTDLYTAMPGGGSYQEIEQCLLDECDGIISTNNLIIDALNVKHHNKKYSVVENGFDFEHFLNLEEIQRNSGKSVCYVGAIDHRFDESLLQSLLNFNKELDIDIYSPHSLRLKHDRLHWRGGVDYTSLPNVLLGYDVLIMPFNNDISNLSRSPMKLFEFASTNLPMVIPHYFNDHALSGIYKFDGNDEFVMNVEKALKTKPLNRSLKILKSNSWEYKSKEILAFSGEVSDEY